MKKVHHVIYVPGLSDERKSYEFFINQWSHFGIIPHVFRMNWYDKSESLITKLNRFILYIDKITKTGDIVSLVGGSAGGSAVLNAFIDRPKINAVVNICGRLNEGKNVFPSLDLAARNSPAFKQSVLLFEKREPKMTKELRQKVMTLSPIWDEVVPGSTVFLKGAYNRKLLSIEHMLTGFLAMTLFSPIIINFLKSKSS